jgi:hypothetical protein
MRLHQMTRLIGNEKRGITRNVEVSTGSIIRTVKSWIEPLFGHITTLLNCIGYTVTNDSIVMKLTVVNYEM